MIRGRSDVMPDGEEMCIRDRYRLAENRNKSFVFQWIRKIASDWRNDRSRQELTGI